MTAPIWLKLAGGGAAAITLAAAVALARGDTAEAHDVKAAPVAAVSAMPALPASPPPDPAATRPAASMMPPPAPLPEPFRIKSVLPIEGGMDHGEWHWNPEAGPAAGPLVITVDLAAQVISVFRDGHEIGAAVILYGATDKPTPLGTFPIMQKRRHHISNLYHVPMPYMMRLTNDGVAIHSSDVQWGRASHGCIGVPDAFAAKLFAAASVGDRVIITDGRRAGLPMS